MSNFYRSRTREQRVPSSSCFVATSSLVTVDSMWVTGGAAVSFEPRNVELVCYTEMSNHTSAGATRMTDHLILTLEDRPKEPD